MLWLSANAPPFGDNTKKRESCTCCSFYKRRLWNCPLEWTSNAEASRRICVIHQLLTLTRRLSVESTYPQRHLLLLQSWLQLKFSRFPFVKKERRVNAFQNVCRPSRVALDRASAVRSAAAKLAKFSSWSKHYNKIWCDYWEEMSLTIRIYE